MQDCMLSKISNGSNSSHRKKYLKCLKRVNKKSSIFREITYTIKRLTLHFNAPKELFPVKIMFLSGTKLFSGLEAGIDLGGLDRELVTSIYKEAKSILLHGPMERLLFLHDLLRLPNNKYFNLGHLLL